MNTRIGHLAFCTNIFPGETWKEHFQALKKHVPEIRERMGAPALGLGLRLSNQASLQLSHADALQEFKAWLNSCHCYVFTMNGFPYGHFHRERVKDTVHAPDWTTNERLQYTLRLFRILAALLPGDMEGSISTSPLSYRGWFRRDPAGRDQAIEKATWNIIEVVEQLYRLNLATGTVLHLDLEPEADGLIENSREFVDWFVTDLLPLATSLLQEHFSVAEEEAGQIVRRHLRLCYDVCHFAVGFEEPALVSARLEKHGILIGKWQLSSALKVPLAAAEGGRQAVLHELQKFNEPVYLHQVVTRQADGTHLSFPDLSEALADPQAREAEEWRAHFHVPLFVGEYGLLSSTQEEVARALACQDAKRLAPHLEVETYTWDVLPANLKLPVSESIVREMEWVTRWIDPQNNSNA